MTTISNDSSKTLLNKLPFPLAYLYQELLVEYRRLPASTASLFWKMLDSNALLVKLVAFCAFSSYLNLDKPTPAPMERRLVQALRTPDSSQWLTLIRLLSEFLGNYAASDPKIPDFSEFLDYRINLPQTPPAEFPETINPRKAHSWLEIAAYLVRLETDWLKSDYRLRLPSPEVTAYYFYLLEQALQQCRLLQQNGIYVLVSKDARKTRGFLCQGTRIRPVGIRGISSATLHSLKGRPFLCPENQKQYLSLFPFMLSLLQKYQERTAFRDLLFYEYASFDRMVFYGYRIQQSLDHEQCAPGAISLWQKELHKLEIHAGKPDSVDNDDAEAAPSLVGSASVFVGRSEIFRSLFRQIEKQDSAYLYIRSRSGYGKTAIFNYLRQCLHAGKLPLAIAPSIQPVFIWHFCHSGQHPLCVLRSLYRQIQAQVYRKSPQEIAAHIQKLPGGLENLPKHFARLVQQVSEDVLQPEYRQLVIAVDGIDAFDVQTNTIASLLDFFPARLPNNVFFWLSWRTAEHRNQLLSESYCQDRIPLHAIRCCRTPLIELAESPLAPLSPKEVATWVEHCPEFASEPEYFSEEIQHKSGGDPLYLSLLIDAIATGILPAGQPYAWPQGRCALMHHCWQNLVGDSELSGYRLAGILAIMQHPGNDNLFSALLSKPLHHIRRERWRLNLLLQYHGCDYDIGNHTLRDYITAQFHLQDNRSFHHDLIQYYCGSENNRDYNNFSDQALWHLGHHLYHTEKLTWLNSIAHDDSFKEEKINRFKAYNPYLQDITLAMQANLRRQNYRQVLVLGYRYYQVVSESLKGMAHAFYAAAHGNYAMALERIRIIEDEHDLFKGILIVLWHSLANQDYEQMLPILQELGHIGDDRVSFTMLKLEPLIEFALIRLKERGIDRIDYIIGKHGLSGEAAISYLLDLHQRVQFSEGQLAFVVDKLLLASEQIVAPDQRANILATIVPLWLKVEALAPQPQLWKRLLRLVDVERTTPRLRMLKDLARATLRLAKKDYQQQLLRICRAPVLVSNADSLSVIDLVRYAMVQLLLNDDAGAAAAMKQAFALIQKRPFPEKKEFIAQAVAEIADYPGNPLIDDWWNALQELVEGLDRSKQRGICREMLVPALAGQQAWEAAWHLLQENAGVESRQRLASLRHFATSLQQAASADQSTLIYWEALLDYIGQAADPQSWELLAPIADGLFALGIPADDLVWIRYQAICDRLPEQEQQKNIILANLACGFAQKGFLTKAQSIIYKLSSPELRAEPMAEVGTVLARQGEWTGALEIAQEIAVVPQKFRVFQAIAANIIPGDHGRGPWKKLTTAMQRTASEHRHSDKYRSQIEAIIGKLAQDLPLDESSPLWQDIFAIVAMTSVEAARAGMLGTIVLLLAKAENYEKTTDFWPLIYPLLDSFESAAMQTEIDTVIAQTLTRLGRLSEAENFLKQALTLVQTMPQSKQQLDYLAKIAAGYRELGQEQQCREMFSLILQYSGVAQGKRLKNWSSSGFIVKLVDLGLEDLGRYLAEKILLASVELGDETPPPESLLLLADVCIAAGRYDWARLLFFQLLPILARDYGNIAGKVPLYIRMIEILEKLAQWENFHELWQRMEAMVPNFPKVNMQERCLEDLAYTLSQHGGYHEHQMLWHKLFNDARYVGGRLESLRSCLRIAKSLLTIAPWTTVETFLRQQGHSDGQDLWQAIAQLSSDYDKVHISEMVAEMLLAAEDFSEIAAAWEQLTILPENWQRKDCQGLAAIQFSKIMARHAQKYGAAICLPAIEKLLSRISKAQQQCEGYLMVANEYLQSGQRQESEHFLRQAQSIAEQIEPQRRLKIIPALVHCLLGLGQYDHAWQQLALLPHNATRIELALTTVAHYLDRGATQEACQILADTVAQIEHIDSRYGDRSKMYSLAARYYWRLERQAPAMQLLEQAFVDWKQITSSSYRKDAIAAILAQWQDTLQIPESLWTRLLTKAQEIPESTYRYWAMEEVAAARTRQGDFTCIYQVLEQVPPQSRVKWDLLQVYAGVATSKAHPPEAFALLQVLRFHEDKLVLGKALADVLEEKGDLDSLFQLYLMLPGDFGLLCYLTAKILALSLRQQGKECFYNWFTEIAAYWELPEIGDVAIEEILP